MIDSQQIQLALKALGGRAGLVTLSAASGVPLSTLEKIARGDAKNPRLDTVNALLPHLRLRKRKQTAA